jgi:serine protease Do
MASALNLVRGHGVIVSDVWPGGPAEAAGLKVGDILESVDGEAVDNLPTVTYKFRLRDSTEKVAIVVNRAGQSQSLSVAAVEQRSEFDALSAMADPQKNLVTELGILGVEIDAEIARNARGLREPYGVIVVARAAGATIDVPLQSRDVIRTLNGREVRSLQGLRDQVAALKPGAPVALQIQRDARLMYVTFVAD